MGYKLFFVIIGCLLLLVGNYFYQSFQARIDFNNHLKYTEKTCPGSYFVNRMPSVYTGFSVTQFVQAFFQNFVTGVHEKETSRLQINYLNEKGLFIFREGGYFIDLVDDQSGANKNGAGQNVPVAKNKKLFDKDLEWVSKNCNVKPSYVY